MLDKVPIFPGGDTDIPSVIAKFHPTLREGHTTALL